MTSTSIAGVLRVRRQVLGDARGFFSRFFCADELREAGFDATVAQVNHTMTGQAGTVRGLHFQRAPHAEIKFVSCLRGQVFDVAIDLRRNSPTYLRWHAEVLSADNYVSLLVPKGCAHGFQTLTENCEMLYLHSAAYSQSAEGGVNPRDPAVAVAWPLAITELSPRDASHPFINSSFDAL